MNVVRVFWRNFQKFSKHSIQFFLLMLHSCFHFNIGCTYKMQVCSYLDPNLYVKIAIKLSISPKIVVSHKNLGGADNFFSYRVGWFLREGWGNFAAQGGAEPLGGLGNLWGLRRL